MYVLCWWAIINKCGAVNSLLGRQPAAEKPLVPIVSGPHQSDKCRLLAMYAGACSLNPSVSKRIHFWESIAVSIAFMRHRHAPHLNVRFATVLSFPPFDVCLLP